jgi:WD40 repeat protein
MESQTTPMNTSAAGTISVDTANQVELITTLSGHSQQVVTLIISKGGDYLASSSLDKQIKLWDVANREDVHTFHVGLAVMNNIAFSPDGQLLACAEKIWDVESKQVVHTVNQNNHGTVAFSPTGERLAIAQADQPIIILNVSNGQITRTIENQLTNIVHDIEFSSDGTQFVIGGHSHDRGQIGIVALWDLESGQLIHVFEEDPVNSIHSVALSHDGNLIASAGTEGTTKVWAVESEELLFTIQGNSCYDVEFSPDGSLLATAGCNNTVKLWDMTNNNPKLLRTLEYGNNVMTIVFSPDGTLLASGSYDSKIYLWGISQKDE